MSFENCWETIYVRTENKRMAKVSLIGSLVRWNWIAAWVCHGGSRCSTQKTDDYHSRSQLTNTVPLFGVCGWGGVRRFVPSCLINEPRTNTWGTQNLILHYSELVRVLRQKLQVTALFPGRFSCAGPSYCSDTTVFCASLNKNLTKCWPIRS